MTETRGTVVNKGTLPTAPTLTVDGPAVAPYFENVTAGKTVTLAVDLAEGERLVIDFARKAATRDGVTKRAPVTVDSRWWTLAPGPNEIRSNAEVVVAHRDAFLH